MIAVCLWMIAVCLWLIAESIALLVVSQELGQEQKALAVATSRAEQAEKCLAHCMNGGWFNSAAGVLNCGRVL